MGLISKYVDGRIDNKFKDLNISYDEGIQFAYDEEYKQRENKLFYMGDTEEIAYFYKSVFPTTGHYVATNSFYRVVSGNIPIMHYPLANMITKSMVNLVFQNAPHISIETGNKVTDKNFNDLINKIYDSNKKSEMFQTAGEYESYSGAVGFKIIIDKIASDYPIIIPYAKEDIIVTKKYNRINEIIFKDYYEDDKKKKFTLYSIYGKGYIDYKLYSKNSTGNFGSNNNVKDLPLNTIPETAGLSRIEVYNMDGTPYNKILAIYKENKTGGVSDYANLRDDFVALDEVYSNMMDFIRKSKIKTYRSSNTMMEDPITGKMFIKNDYDCADIIINDANPTDKPYEVKRDIVNMTDSINAYSTTFNNILQRSLQTCGLAPATIGLDAAGSNASGLALNIREKVSIRTRDEKITRWTECLEDLTECILSLYSSETFGPNRIKVKVYDGDIKIKFADYGSYEDKIASLSTALDNGLIDKKSAMIQLYPDKSPEEIDAMIDNMKNSTPTQVISDNTYISKPQNDIGSENNGGKDLM